MRKTVRVYFSRQYGDVKHLNKFVSTVLSIVLSRMDEFISFLESHPTYSRDYSRTAKVDVKVIDELVAHINENLGEQYTKTDVASLAVKFVFEKGYVNAVEHFIGKNSGQKITASGDTVSETDTTSVSTGGNIDTTDSRVPDTVDTAARDASDTNKCSEEELIKWWWWTVMWVNKRRNLERAKWRKRRARFTWRKHF